MMFKKFFQNAFSYSKALRVVIGAVLLFPQVSFANEILDMKILENEHEVEVALFATEPLGKPRIRTSRGLIRAWFPEIKKNARLTIQGDGERIKWIKLRPGTRGTSLVKIRLGDERVLKDSQVRVVQIGSHGRIQIQKNLLPGSLFEKKEERNTVTENAQEALIGSIQDQQKRKQKKDQIQQAHSTLFDSAAIEEKVSESTDTVPAKQAPIAQKESPLNWGIYLLIVALLLLVYVAIRILQKGKAPLPKNKLIQIIATKRMSPRHQLVVVRALGEDHLLAMGGGKTEKITSMPSEDLGEDPLENSFGKSLISGLKPGFFERLKMGLGIFNTRKNMISEDSIFEETYSSGSKFGEDLIKAAASSSYARQSAPQPLFNQQAPNNELFNDFIPSSSLSQSLPPSDAIAGILKLRDQSSLH